MGWSSAIRTRVLPFTKAPSNRLLEGRQPDLERRADARLALHLQAPARDLDPLPHRGEAEVPGPHAKALPGVEALSVVEDLEGEPLALVLEVHLHT